MTARLTSNRFVGRVGELAELQLAVREASSGHPVLVLLGGDSGIGKTRLVGELISRLAEPDGAAAEEVLVLRGDGVEQTDGELPYAPLLGALRPLVRAHDPALSALTPGSRAQLATILPGLEADADGAGGAGHAGGVGSGGGVGSPGGVGGQSSGGQLRLFEALLELLDTLAGARPVLLVLEDMHWADRSTRAFVAFLARSLRDERLCLVLTYRADELSRRHPLRPLLAELERLDRARRVELAPLDRDELGLALTDILGAAPGAGLLDRLYTRSEGNPLYTEELLAAGLDGRGAAPQSLRDAFLVRTERLSADAQRLARAVAVGRSLDERALADVTGLEPAALHDGLRETVAEQILIPGDDGRFSFRHALLREALYDDLLPGERGELHIALARWLERECEIAEDRELDRIATIAGHYDAAGDQPAALHSTIRAARAAQRAMAFGEAAHLSERALELWPRVDDPVQVAGIDHVELLRRAAEAHRAIDHRSRTVVLLNEALRELEPDRDPARYAGLLARLARMTWSLNRGEEAVRTGERALAMLPADEAEVRPLLLAWLARVRYLRGRFRQAVSDGEVALAAARAAGDRVAEAEVLNTLGMATASLGDVDAGVGLLRGAIALATENCDDDSRGTAFSNLADILSQAGRTADALATAREGLAATPRYHSRNHDWSTLTVAEMAYESGDWELAREHLAPAPSVEDGLLFIYRQLAGATLDLATGAEDDAAAALEAIAGLVAVSAEPQWIAPFGAFCAELAVRRGDLDAARAAVHDALDRIELCTDDIVRVARVSATGAQIEAERALRARDLKITGERRDALTRLRLHIDRLAAAAEEGGPVERARLADARAELARARGRGAERAWARAAEAWLALERPYPGAIARWREAEVLVAAGRRDEAAVAAGAALEAARRLGARWLAREVAGLAERARLELRGVPDAEAVAEEHVEDPFGLTPRERQVLALLAEGATNRQIGAALFMAEKTASVHVSRILAKLDVQGRTQAAAVAHRLHLA